MTAITDFMEPQIARRPAATDRSRTVVLRLISMGLGLALLLSMLGLWLLPGSNMESEVMLMKVALSAFFALGGITLLQSSLQRRPRA